MKHSLPLLEQFPPAILETPAIQNGCLPSVCSEGDDI